MKSRVVSFSLLALASALSALSVSCSSSDDDGKGTGESNLASPTLPVPTGTCPEFTEGRATFTVNGTARTVQLYVDPVAASAADGPLVLYWYGTAGQPEQALQALGTDGVARIKAAGGVVAAPVHANDGIFPWIQGDVQLDFALADEIVACAKQKIGIDARHLHSNGFSAGALFTAQLSFARSNYLASVATYSGGADNPSADPSNLFPAMILNGGVKDVLVLKFQETSLAYKQALVDAGHFAFVCDHGGGHSIPPDGGPSVTQFFFDHPYELTPEPYLGGLPASFPSYCSL